MPITPFHFGPGAALHAIAPRQVSFIAFCMANVVIDIEPLYYMLTHQPPLHRFMHTYIGAALVALIVVTLFFAARGFARKLWLPNLFGWQQLRLRAVIIGALAGSYSHIVLDSVMHADMRPFAPFNDSNALLGLVSLSALHWICIGAGVAGMLVIAVRALVRKGRATD